MSRLIKTRRIKYKPLEVGMIGDIADCSKVQEVEYEERIEAQELWCMECQRYVRFPIDLSLDGNHEIKCPNCGHIHYRVVKKGVITEDRYNPSPGMMTYVVSASQTTSAYTSYYQDTSSGSNYLTQSWTTTVTAG